VDSHDHWQSGIDLKREEYEFRCPYCHSERVIIHPIGIPYHNEKNENTDLGDDLKKHFSGLPHIGDAVMRCLEGENNTGVLVECADCGQATNGFFNSRPSPTGSEKIFVDKTKMKKYLLKFYGLDEMRCCQN
jgi:transcription elongation factor Elf1